MTPSTKLIDTKYKEIYYSPAIENIESKDDKSSELMFMMNLMAFRNLELVNRTK